MQEASRGGYQWTVKIWIRLNRFKGHFKRSEKCQIGCFSTCCQFSQKLFDSFSLCLVYSILGMILINYQEMDFIVKVGKARCSPFSHNYWYYSVITKCCPNVLHHVASLLWTWSCPKIWKVWNHSKGHSQGQKGQFGPLWFISANISETVHYMMTVLWNAYSKLYMAFQFTWSNLTLDDIERSNQC